ncbi:4-(cytidine 5'-diphospho)-2-C-methyl-D-erythritol kinase [Actibacterium lipolyticum]|uniref:4-diphosphocytidyl-2-C-methyl-D-erythritol kinase n=1 Tax=Actibacterium lipolyticum TaxID=1524263 RepID=A0A238KU84_9RHOB|nr:4-(cytidine 5'-diphospho)-2-C-methyl-D-erythritol kinase [Actibacterium lipolyticum]SMX45722.1 4-diphosphocytidyl-2-C-methyl-D-erythritol kinase [Actibacterium lipolyticum]
MAIEVFAPAKVNLCLHVTGQRDDGYHLLDSLVAFAPVGDSLKITDGKSLSLTVDGPEAAGVPVDESNLVMKAAALMGEGQGAAMTLTKNLPAASGIGGGSSDAAAALRGLLRHWDREDLADMPQSRFAEIADKALGLGADLPMCLMCRPARVRGIGERIDFTNLGPIPTVLVNPRIEVSTPKIFAALASRENAPLPDELPAFSDVNAFAEWLAQQRNDLQAPALKVEPAIGRVLDTFERADGCLLSRMSGSGATCFGVFPDEEAALAAEHHIRTAHPDWWVQAGSLGDQSERARPQVS